MKKITTAIVGFGLSGKVFHARVLNSLPEFEVSTVVTSRADEVRADLPGAKVARSIDDVLQDSSIELVIVATPNQEHAPLSIKALESGKHVVVEKPFAVSSTEGRKVIECATRAGKLLSVFHNRRWDNGFLTLKRELQAGTLGELYQYEARFDRFRPKVSVTKWRESAEAGAGILYDLGSHLIDQALHLFGMPQSLMCNLHAQRDGASSDDYFVIQLDYGKLQVTLRSGTVVAIPGPVLQAHGDRGSFFKHGLDPQEDALKAGLSPERCADSWGLDNDLAELALVSSNGEVRRSPCRTEAGCYHEFYRGIFRSIREATPSPVVASDALAVIQLIEQCVRSAKEGRVIHELSLD